MTTVFRNKLFYTIAQTIRSAALLCATGPLIQTFIKVSGFGNDFNYLHTSLIQLVNILTILICSRFADTKNMLKRVVFINIPTALLFFLYIPVCFINDISSSEIILMLTGGILQAVFCGLYTVCEYKLPYVIFKSDDYGVVLATSGVSVSLLSLLFSSTVSFFSSFYDYKIIIFYSFLVSVLFLLAAAILFSFMKPLNAAKMTEDKNKAEKIPLKKIFSSPIFYKLAIPNVLRGYAYGVTTVITILAFHLGYDEKMATLIFTMQSLALLIGCAVFGFLSKRIKMHKVLFVSSLFFLLFPLMLIKNHILFITVFTVLICTRTIVDNAVPAVLIRAVPGEIAGPYNAWRMILHTAGILLATSTAGMMSPTVLIVIAVSSHLLFAFMYAKNHDIKSSC